MISTRTPHAGSDRSSQRHRPAYWISTRTPHAGSDVPRVRGDVRRRLISTRTPHAGSDNEPMSRSRSWSTFQPALPMRGVTVGHEVSLKGQSISTRTPHAGSDLPVVGQRFHVRFISTRTPHAGSDHALHDDELQSDRISTRTPHAGSDMTASMSCPSSFNFNPHSPCGE